MSRIQSRRPIPELRVQIDELISKYELEPTLRDVIVEGDDDRSVIDWYLKGRVDKNYSVYTIDQIDVPAELLNKHNQRNGNKGRLIALGFELNQVVWKKRQAETFTLVCDSDTDRLIGRIFSFTFLLSTDFSCLEMYLYNPLVMDKFISLCLKGYGFSGTDFLHAITDVLVRLWLLKTTAHELGYGLSWIDPDKVITIHGLNIKFNEDDFVSRYLNTKGLVRQKDEFLTKLKDFSVLLNHDGRFHIDGHHFTYLAHLICRKLGLWSGDEESFRQAMVGCLDREQLDSYPLFHALASRCSA